jgi:hypothetical protein
VPLERQVVFPNALVFKLIRFESVSDGLQPPNLVREEAQWLKESGVRRASGWRHVETLHDQVVKPVAEFADALNRNSVEF